MKKQLSMPFKKLVFVCIIGFLIVNNLMAEIVITGIKKADCNVANGAVTIKVTKGTKPYTFELIGPTNISGSIADESVTINNLQQGIYQLIVRDKHRCAGTKEFTIEETDMNVSIESYMIPTPEGINSAFLLVANATDGAPPYVYSWPDGQYVATSGGTYSCTVTDNKKCRKTGTINVLTFLVPRSKDPNEIVGPDGYGYSRFVSVNDELIYKVRFENDPLLATAPAKRVSIFLPIDKHLEPYSFTLRGFGFGKYTFEAPENRLFYQTRLDLRDSLGLFLDISTGIDITKNRAYWIFESVDPKTGSKNTLDPYQGFLPVNDSVTHSGEGFINFSFKPRKSCLTADSVRMHAEIIFDKNEAMNTNTAWNLIDALPPASTIDSIYFDPFSSRYLLSFTGKDDTLGCGLKDYDLYISESNTPFRIYQTNLKGPEFPFLGKQNTEYSFFSAARDNVNNASILKYWPEKTFYYTNEPFLNSPTQFTRVCTDMELPISWKPVKGSSLDFEFSSDNGKSFSLIASDINSSSGVLNWKVPSVYTGTTKGMIRVLNANSRAVVDTSEIFTILQGVIADAGESRTVCSGTEVTLGIAPGIGSYSYNWSPSSGLNSSSVANPVITVNSTSTYLLTVNDDQGCHSFDSVKITIPMLPELTINGLDDIYCFNSEPAEINGFPSNGTLTGVGIKNNLFYPDKAGVGAHEISYLYTDENSCLYKITKETRVDEALEVSFSGLANRYNIKDNAVILTGTPRGGIFSGDGMVGSTFNPSTALMGEHSITYTYTLPGGCTNSSTMVVTVDKLNSLTEDELCTNQFKIFPGNPISEITIYFEPCRTIEGTMALYDINGNQIEVIQKGLINSVMKQVNVSNLLPGVYFVVIKSGDKSTYQKFTKIR